MRPAGDKSSTRHRPRQSPPLPARYVLAALILVGLAVAFPMFTVWKQVYITNSSLLQERLADSVAVLSQKTTRLRMDVEQLTRNERIERVAREALGLDYPASGQLVIVRPPERPRRRIVSNWGFLAVLRRSLRPDRG
jgi:cell division protein FtsL